MCVYVQLIHCITNLMQMHFYVFLKKLKYKRIGAL